MNNLIVLAVASLSVGALYFLVASGLGLIFGLLRVLSFAQGAILGSAAYVGWLMLRHFPLDQGSTTNVFVLACLVGIVLGAVLAFATEVFLIRPLYARDHLDQILVTVGLGFVLTALINGIWGPDSRSLPVPRWAKETINIGDAAIPIDRIVLIVVAALLLVGLEYFLRSTRSGLIVRAGVENRDMVRALGIDVRVSFTLIFTIGGAAAGLAGVLAGMYSKAITPAIGDSYLLYAFIVLIIGGLGSLRGAAIAAVLTAFFQQFANFYIASGFGDLLIVGLMAVVLLVRPQGILGKKGRTI